MNLLSKDVLGYISRYIYNSDIPINLNSFEFVEDYEKLLLKEFESFKVAFEKLDLPDKNNVIKFWTFNRGIEFDKYLEFCPENLKSFDVLDFHNISPDDTVALDAHSSISPLEIFYPEHYKCKFTNLIIYFLLFEEEYMKEVLVNPIAHKGNYNPLEWLNIESEISYNQFNLRESPFNACSKKNMARLFWLLSKSGLRPQEIGKIDANYCKELCEEYGFIYSDTIRQNFKILTKNELDHFKHQIFPLITLETQSAILPPAMLSSILNPNILIAINRTHE